MHKAVRENREKLGALTIGEWVIDYSKTIDPAERTNISHIEYISRSEKTQTLSEKEKDALRKILWTFDSLLLVTPVMSEPLFSEAYKIITGIGVVRRPIPISAPIAQEIPEQQKTPIPPLPKREVPKPIISEYEDKISPYERKREPIPELKKEIKTFPLEIEKMLEEESKKEPQETLKKEEPRRVGGYQIRTMKTDIEKTKKQPIPPKPQPKIKDNIVDLSGK